METPSSPTKLITGLRAVRKYRDEEVPGEIADAILEAGRWTGSAKNRQDWAFVVIDDPELQERVADTGSFSQPLRDARLVIVPVCLPGGYEFDIGRVSQNMMLAASALGVGSCPVTLHQTDAANEVLKLPPDHVARYALCFGYPDVEAEEASRSSRSFGGGRKPLDELVVRNAWADA